MKKLIITITSIFTVVTAYATDIATSQAYVDTAAAGLQDNLPAKTSDKVATYTTTAGTTGEREIKTELGNESTNQSDTGIPTVGTVKTAVDGKQEKLLILPLSEVNVLTYSDSLDGVVTSTPIYDSTINTFDNGLVTAKSLNDAIIAGVESEVTPIQTPQGKLWRINRTAPKVLPTTANLPASIDGTGRCSRAQYSHTLANNGCSTTIQNNLDPGDFGVVFPYNTGISYPNNECIGTGCGKEIKGISACVNMPGLAQGTVAPQSSWAMLDTAYEYGKTNTTPNGSHCFCKLINPTIPSARWIKNTNQYTEISCGQKCAVSCASETWAAARLRAAMFGAAPVPAQ